MVNVCFWGSRPSMVDKEPYELNSGEYMVERGTFIPLKRQLEEMKRAGVDLEAHRMAHSDFVAGETVDLDAPFVDYRDIDEFDLDAKREYFLRQEILQAQAEVLRKQKDAQDLARFRSMNPSPDSELKAESKAESKAE